jgi:hypothetical protein
MTDHLNWLLDSLEPKLVVVRTLSEKYQIEFFCEFSSGQGEGGFTLDSNTLTRIAKFGIRLVVDLYPPSMEIEIDEVEASPGWPLRTMATATASAKRQAVHDEVPDRRSESDRVSAGDGGNREWFRDPDLR